MFVGTNFLEKASNQSTKNGDKFVVKVTRRLHRKSPLEGDEEPQVERPGFPSSIGPFVILCR
jgi:hypothetical protein